MVPNVDNDNDDVDDAMTLNKNSSTVKFMGSETT